MPTPEELKQLALQNPGQLQTGATDPLTGQQFQSYAPNIINSDALTPSPSLAYTTAQSQAAYPVAGLNSEVATPEKLGTEGQKGQDFTTQLQDLNNQILGQSAFQKEQETAQKIPELQKAQTDLSAQLKGLQNEALAIPLQLQNEAMGRGITVGGLAPIQTGRLRENAIKALTVSSLLESSRGNLATAQTLADRAVAQKFDPIKEQIAVKTANLDLILKSPAFTLEEKNRAQAQKDIQDAKLKKAEKDEADQKAILETTNKAAANQANFVATPEYPTASLALDAMGKAKTPLDATLIGAKTGLISPEKDTGFTLTPGQARYDAQGKLIASASKEDKLLSPTEAATLGVPYGTTESQAAKMGITPKKDVGNLSPAVATKVQGIAGQFDGEQIVKDYNQIIQSLDAVKRAGTSPTDDIQRVYAFAKIMDPNSVVREGEYKTVQDYSTALLERTGLKAKRIFDNTGFLTEEARGFMLKTLDNRFASTEKAYNNLYNEYGRRIDKITGQADGTDYITDYSRAFETESGSNLSKSIDEATKAGYSSLEIYKHLRAQPEYVPQMQEAEKAGYTPEQIVDYLKKKANTVSLNSLKQSIITQESGGDYKAIGAKTPYGKALGKYQIIPQFHFSKIGLSNNEADKQKFLNSPQLQDKLFATIIDELSSRYKGNPQKIAAAYYGGDAAAKIVGTPAGDKPQKNAPSINQYVNSVLSRTG